MKFFALVNGESLPRTRSGDGRGMGQSGAAGFTLIEMLAVLVIVGVLASIALPLAELAHKRQKEEELRSALREIRSAIDAYKRLSDEGRIARNSDQSGYPQNLEILVKGVQDIRSPSHATIYLLRRLPSDPFAEGDGKQGWALRSYESPPDRPKPGKDVFDVLSASDGIGLNGVAYRQW